MLTIIVVVLLLLWFAGFIPRATQWNAPWGQGFGGNGIHILLMIILLLVVLRLLGFF